MDLGGHRFFSKSKVVTDWWCRMMPVQRSRSRDDILLGLDDKELSPGGPDPETEDRVLLKRHRVSRIFFSRKFFDYPISLSKATFSNMGFIRTVKAGFGYLFSMLFKRKEQSLEDFYINRFGKPLYKMFFEGYTRKVWGLHPSKLGADWGGQRVKGLSVWEVVKDMVGKKFGRTGSGRQETSLIQEFIYPKYGPGQLWETVAEEVKARGGEIRMSSVLPSSARMREVSSSFPYSDSTSSSTSSIRGTDSGSISASLKQGTTRKSLRIRYFCKNNPFF